MSTVLKEEILIFVREHLGREDVFAHTYIGESPDKDTPGLSLDSLDSVEMIMALEEKYDLKASENDDLKEAKTIGHFIDYVHKQLSSEPEARSDDAPDAEIA